MANGNTNWGAITGAAVLLSIAAGLITFYMDGSWLLAIAVPIVIFGTFELLSSFFRNDEADRWGTSDSGAAVFYGFTLLAIGGAMLVFHLANNNIFPIVYAIVLAAIYLLLRATVKKND